MYMVINIEHRIIFIFFFSYGKNINDTGTILKIANVVESSMKSTNRQYKMDKIDIANNVFLTIPSVSNLVPYKINKGSIYTRSPKLLFPNNVKYLSEGRFSIVSINKTLINNNPAINKKT
jgi:hypothetical protein